MVGDRTDLVRRAERRLAANVTDMHAARRDRLRAKLIERDLDTALVTNLINVRYLTGYTGSNGALLLAADGRDVFGTDGRYIAQSAREVPDLEQVIARPTLPALFELVEQRAVRRLGYESHVVTVDGHLEMAERLPAVELVSVDAAVEGLREIKDEQEIAAVAEACAIADRALADLIAAGGLRAGRSEQAIGRDLDNRMLDLGAEAVSFETIVASGPNSAVPHHRPSERTVESGDLLTLDFGATYHGYHSDMTRTFAIGTAAKWQQDMYELVRAAQQAGRAALRPGADLVAVDAAARDVIVAAGNGDLFSHGLGHGVGLEIHEAPSLSATSTGKLVELAPVTVEPGVYREGRAGVRIEDTLVVRPDGPQLLTMTTKDFTVL